MKNIFIIVGYGIPENIFRDENYNFYLKMSFNRIWDVVSKIKNKDPLIIFSGGKTDLIKPYKRSEAGEMNKLFKQIIVGLKIKNQVSNWKFLLESNSLSSLENIVYSHKLIKFKQITKANIYPICEQTRYERVDKISRQIFKKPYQVKTIPVDFDFSVNRYLDPIFLNEKNNAALKFELLALKDKNVYKKYCDAHKERIKYFRQAGPKKHIEAIQLWWEEKMEEFYNMAK